MNTLWKAVTNVITKTVNNSNVVAKSLLVGSGINNHPSFISKRFLPTLLRMHQRNMEQLENPVPKHKRKSALNGKPFAKGVILKTLIRKPRKPNSANRKCVLVKLSIGKEMVAYVPGIGHNLQEHQTVLCRVGKLKDTPSVKIKCVRGKYDLPHVRKPGE